MSFNISVPEELIQDVSDQNVIVSGHSQLVDVSCQHLDVSGELQVDGHSQLVDVSCQHLDVTGNTTLGGTLDVTGNIYSNGLTQTSLETNSHNYSHFRNIYVNNGKNGGILLHSGGSYGGTVQNISWKMVINSDGPNVGTTEGGGGYLYFWYGGNSTNRLTTNDSWNARGYLNNGSNQQMNFTGQHRCFIKDIPYTSISNEYVGRIVCADQNINISISGSIKKGNQAITQNETLPYVSLSTKNRDKSCFGVIFL